MRPVALRPPDLFLETNRLFSGFVPVISLKVDTVMKRRAGEVGLYLLMLSAIFITSYLLSQTVEELDALAVGRKRNDSFLVSGSSTGGATHAFDFAIVVGCVYFCNFNLEDFFHGSLDLGFGGVFVNFESVFLVGNAVVALFGKNRFLMIS